MICPNINIKEVFDGFNEMVEALGGKPMTEEEFKSGELRNQRTGLDYSAMEAAYKLYHRNGGNFLDLAPNGKTSILFQTLLSEFGGDRTNAIKAKSAVYSNRFREWFGDWLQEDKTNVSKVVDENGEPLVVYHHTDNSNLTEFSTDFENYFAKDGGTKEAMFFDENKTGTLGRKYDIPVFLNIKDLNEYNETKQQLHDRGTTYREVVNQSAAKNNSDGGVHMKDFDDNKMEHQSIWIVHNSNQIKSATGNIEIEKPGTGFSTTDNNIYKRVNTSAAFLNTQSLISPASIYDVVYPDIAASLLDGDIVSSKDVIEAMINNDVFNGHNRMLADILQKHDIPVKIDNSLGIGTLAETVIDSKGNAVILINGNLLSGVSKSFLGTTILHEMIHAVTVNAIDNPQTKEQKSFVKANKNVFKTLKKAFKGREYLFNNTEYGLYALTNEKEFAAEFMTDDGVRNIMYQVARELDKSGSVVQMLKDFVNVLSNLLINRSIFASNEELLTDYQNKFQSFLEGQETQNIGKFLSKSEIRELCSMNDSELDANEAIINATKELNHFIETAQHNKLINVKKAKNQDEFEKIAERLQTRISAVRTSALPLSKKQAAINNTSKILDMYTNDHTPRYTAMRATVSNVIPQLLEDLDYLRSVHENDQVLSSAEYMYQLHSNFRTYEQIFTDIRTLLSDKQKSSDLIAEYNQGNKQGSEISIDDIKELDTDIANFSGAINSALIILGSQQNKIVANQIEERSKQAGSLEGAEYAALLLKNHKFEDISGIWSKFGSIDSSTNEALRIISNMLNDANEKAHIDTVSKAEKLVRAAKALKKGEKLRDLYETYNGKRTGYVVREVNFGQFYDAYDKKMEEINKLISKSFGIQLDKDNRKAPDSDGTKVTFKINGEDRKLTATEAWNILRNGWLSENCHRKYNKEYYENWADVPQCAKDALDDINSQIQAILIQADAIDQEGYRHLDKLSEQQWKEYNKLQIERKYLYSDYDMFGNKKDVGDVSYEIAKALQKLNNALYEDGKDRVKNEEAWREARQKIIDDPNKTEDDLRNWDIRNSRLVFRKDEGHDVWKQIEEELDMAKPNYGEEHDKLSKEIDDLLKPYKLQNGEILADEMTEAVKNLLKDLYRKRVQLEIQLANENAIIKSKREARKAIIQKYIEYEDNDYIKSLRQEYYKEFTDDEGVFDEDSFYIAMMEFGFFSDIDESFLDLYDSFQLYSWNKHSVAKDKEKYMKYEPGDGWVERQNDSKWINPEFKKYEYYGSTMIPLKEKYANKQWDKIKGQYDPLTGKTNGTLGEMYKLTLDTIKESNELQTNRVHADNYLLPQVMASSMRRIIRARSGFYKELIYIVAEKLGFRLDQDSYIDAGVGDDIMTDKEGNQIKPKKHVGSYADGRSYNTIPQYYTKKLDDPSMISSDLVNMLISYYRMSKMYNEKSKIKDDCEAIVDRLETQEYIEQSSGGQDIETIRGEKSNSFKTARQFLDMQMYGQHITRIPLLGGKYEATISFQTLKQWTTAVNLGMNLKVAAVGFMTSQWVHLINACTGQKYSKRHLASAFIEVAYRIGKSIFGLRYINNHDSNDKLMKLMELLNAAGQGEKKGEHTNRNILVQGILGNLTFGMLSGFDFLSKSNIMVAALKAHKYVDGEFLTFDDLERYRAKLSEKEYQDKLTRWSKESDLYSLFSVKNKELVIEEKYKSAWEKQRNQIMSRVDKYAEDADGMATQLQKALMTQNFVGMFFLIHRQYLGLMLQQRWGDRVYDYDTRQYKNGIFKTAIKYCSELFKNSLFGSGVSGALLGLAVIGTGYGPALGATLGMVGNQIYRATHRGTKKKSISEINREFFGMDNALKQMTASLLPFGYKPKYNNPIDEKTYLNQRQNFYDIKRIICEVLLYNLVIAPTAGLAAVIADDDDDNKWWLQMMAYWMRAFQWEAYTPYRSTELLGAIKSATAATSVFDKTQNFFNSMFSVLVPYASMNLLIPSTFESIPAIGNVIFGTDFGTNQESTDEESDYYDEEITRGAYSYNEFAALFNNEDRGWTRREQAMLKMLPFHNLYEQIKDSKSKRRYIENQIMHIKQDNTSGNTVEEIAKYYYQKFTEE